MPAALVSGRVVIVICTHPRLWLAALLSTGSVWVEGVVAAGLQACCHCDLQYGWCSGGCAHAGCRWFAGVLPL